MNTHYHNFTPKTFITADWHFGHDITKWYPWRKNLDDAALIARWNAQVRPQDVVYNLGDFYVSYHKDDDDEVLLLAIVQLLQQLNGVHHLILGNHDDLILRHKDYILSQKKPCGAPILQSITHYQKILHEATPYILCHYPLAEWEQNHAGSVQLHGHLHGHKSGIAGRILNVGLDMHKTMLQLADIHQNMQQIDPCTHFSARLDKICA